MDGTNSSTHTPFIVVQQTSDEACQPQCTSSGFSLGALVKENYISGSTDSTTSQPDQLDVPIEDQGYEDPIVMIEEELSDAESVDQDQRNLSRKDFEIEKLIGEGANASVYKIKMIETGEVYALKVMKKSDIVKRNLL